MAHLRMTAHYDAPVERVFELAIDYPRYPEWSVLYEEITNVSGLPDEVGTRFNGVIKLLGRKMAGSGEVTGVERPHYVEIAGKGSGGTTNTVYRFTEAGAGTDAELELDYELPAGFFGKVADKLFVERSIERALRHSLDNFKAFVEEKVPQTA
jgi:coenzyme Q-binding protein COQ10